MHVCSLWQPVSRYAEELYYDKPWLLFASRFIRPLRTRRKQTICLDGLKSMFQSTEEVTLLRGCVGCRACWRWKVLIKRDLPALCGQRLRMKMWSLDVTVEVQLRLPWHHRCVLQFKRPVFVGPFSHGREVVLTSKSDEDQGYSCGYVKRSSSGDARPIRQTVPPCRRAYQVLSPC